MGKAVQHWQRSSIAQGSNSSRTSPYMTKNACILTDPENQHDYTMILTPQSLQPLFLCTATHLASVVLRMRTERLHTANCFHMRKCMKCGLLCIRSKMAYSRSHRCSGVNSVCNSSKYSEATSLLSYPDLLLPKTAQSIHPQP